MQGNQSKYNGQIEITDLIGEAVKNAVARRNQAMDSEDALLALSKEEAGGVTGGLTSVPLISVPIFAGLISVPIFAGGMPVRPDSISILAQLSDFNC